MGSYTTGKNSTDSALIIDAMDLLYTQKLDGFCIISSDSDFTRLAHRIRQDGILVYGFGKRQTPNAFTAACDRFVYTELLDLSVDQLSENETKTVNSLSKSEDKNKLHELLKEAYEGIARDDGIANIGTLGQQLVKLNSSFDTRTYGHKKLGELIKATELFDVKDNSIKLR